jgi:hypothetical protein
VVRRERRRFAVAAVIVIVPARGDSISAARNQWLGLLI